MNAKMMTAAAEYFVQDLNTHDNIMLALMRQCLIPHVEINDGGLMVLSYKKSMNGTVIDIARNEDGKWAMQIR